MAVKPYKPLYEEGKRINRMKIFEQTQTSLKNFKKEISKIKEDEDKDPEEVLEAVSDVIDQLDDVITDAIDELGACDPVVSSLVDAAQEVDVLSNVTEEE